MCRALGLFKGNPSTWGTASAHGNSQKPQGLPTCGLFRAGEEGRASEAAPPCLVVGLFLCLGMLSSSSSALTAATSAGGARPLEPGSLGGKGSHAPHAHLGSGGTVGEMQSMWHWGGGTPLWSHLAFPPPAKQKLPAQAGTRAHF